MHCGFCGDTTVEVRPCHISASDREQNVPMTGDVYLCQLCATNLAVRCVHSVFVTWVGIACDECGTPSAFDGDIANYPEGIVCDECLPPIKVEVSYFDDDPLNRGVWLCIDCYEKNHYGHRQKQLQPLLDRLANL